MRERIRIGLLWHSASSANLGVGALTVANLALARDVAEEMGLTPEFTILGMREPSGGYVSLSEAKHFDIDARSLFSPRGYWTVVGRQDCVLDIGAGDSFCDIYGAKRFLFLVATKVLTIVRRVPLLLSPQTIGPFTRPVYIAAARWVLNRADSVVARDKLSLDVVRNLTPRAKGVLAVDVAFALPYDDQSHLRNGPRLRVGVNVSGLLHHEATSGRNRFGLEVDYAELMMRFIAELAERPDVEVHLITHATHQTLAEDDDSRVADELAVRFPNAVRAPDFTGPEEAKSYISSLDFLVAGRMHACIAALSAGVPVVPIAYSRKFAGLFGMLGYDRMVPVRGSSTEEALGFLQESLERRRNLEASTKEALAQVQDLTETYREELRRVFHRAIKGR